MTIHNSKGLEFEAVVVLDVNEGCLPFGANPDDDEVAEDKRKFYVACTRAKQFLCVQSQPNQQSRFLRDLDGLFDQRVVEIESVGDVLTRRFIPVPGNRS